MAPKEEEAASLSNEFENEEDSLKKLVAPQASPMKYEYLMDKVIFVTYIHIAGIVGIYYVFYAKWTSLLFTYVFGVGGCVGTIAGAHRLWSHRSFKATLPLEILLMLFHSSNLSLSAIWWVQNHRRHHKYSDTDGDPHNSTRGFFFAHYGWLLVKRHPDCARIRKFIDISDVVNNPVLMFQKRNSVVVLMSMGIVLPMAVLVWGCGESWIIAWHINMLRIAYLWNAAFMINSFAHIYGNRPYDKSVVATQNLLVSVCATGEGFHNYHHTFPWDYRVAELGNNWLNFSTLVIDFFAKIGWAYDLKTVPPEIIAKRGARTGDGTDSWGFKTLEHREEN